MTHKIMTVVGARPQFIKAAPVSKALKSAGLHEVLVHTGQHFDPMMSAVFFHELELDQPDHNLEIHSLGHGAMTARMLEGVERLILEEEPNLMLVYGDTNSTLAGALAAAKLHVPIAHVEAGLRSFNRRMPEEINRVATDHMSRLLLCPTTSAVENLAREGITEGVLATGDVMYDAAKAAVARAETQSTILGDLGLEPNGYAVATVHRAENTDDDDRFGRVLVFLEEAAAGRPLVFVAHPRTRQKMLARKLSFDKVVAIDPVGYIDMAWLVSNAAEVITDSGGLQKEAYFHRTPCTTLRDETEWVETVDSGWNRLWRQDFLPTRREIPEYGDGTSAIIIAGHLKRFLDSEGRTS